jgi:hypothetical protein
MPVELQTGSMYQAKISLGLIESVASNHTIAKKLRDAGFSDVVVAGSGRSRTAQGRWNGPSRIVNLPSQVSDVRRIS